MEALTPADLTRPAGLSACPLWSESLSAEGCTDVVMEATGIYWKPVSQASDSPGARVLDFHNGGSKPAAF